MNRGGKVNPDALRRAIAEPAGADEEGATILPLPASGEEAIEGSGDEDAPNRVVFTLRRDLHKRLDKYLTDRIPFMSRSQLQRLIDDGGVTVNSRRPKASTMLRSGDTVAVFVPPPPPSEIQPEEIPLDVLFEDEHLIVLNKSPDIIVHPARSHLKGTLLNALAWHFSRRSSVGGALSGVGTEFARPGVVHRLDRHTSGVIVFAKEDQAHWKLARQFEDRTVDKRYLAIVHGRVEPPVDVIDLPIGPHPSREKGYREKYIVRHDSLGKPSVTICRVLTASFASSAVGELSVVELELKTGRTHQIRVHLSHLGWPILGDDMYGGRPVTIPSDPPITVAHQALHAALLSFRHPITGTPMTFTAPLPADMQALARFIQRDRPPGGFPRPPGATLDLESLL